MAAGPWGTDIEKDHPHGDPDSLTCRHCGRYRQLQGRTLAPGKRVLVCRVCDAPDPSSAYAALEA